MSATGLFALAAGLAVFLSAAMTFAWRLALGTGKSGFIDAIWSFAAGAAAVIAALAPGGDPSRKILVAALAAIWSVRLGSYLWRRAAIGEDDPRYAALKTEWGDKASLRLFQFLQAQAFAAIPLALAAYVAAHAPRAGLDVRDLIGAAIFCIAVAGESLADRQMAHFRADPDNRGKICDVGLWSWSRHPNYFFEWLMWLSYPAIAIGLDHPAGFLALGAPITMYWLLVHVSGVPPLEQHLARSRPEAFRKYSGRVSMFWPRPPS
jgi:steroid 5-alpha reductase family enzyme